MNRIDTVELSEQDFLICCNTENIEYEIKAQDITEARHWVINHLDLSKDWTIYPKN